ncbi:MAG TPA: ATP-binding cassette domain-containing protein [Kofleriaceae bacterium]|nr:ATP-binding cassette domain-containing protein [Kofleriaceae bacterium]
MSDERRERARAPDRGGGHALEVEGLVAAYGERTILDGVDLRVERGEIRAVLGGSGSGKSTLLKHCVGLLTPTAGRVRLLGQSLHDIEGDERVALLRRIGVLFQYGALLGSITVGENVALPLREHTDLPESVIAELVALKLTVVELPGAGNLMPGELSGGMRKRAALARAMALDPDLLFCDEPSAGLDPLTSAELDELILRLRDRFGMAIVVVTHELASIARIADRAIMLSGGLAIADGPLAEVERSDLPEIRAFFRRTASGDLRAATSALDTLRGANQ